MLPPSIVYASLHHKHTSPFRHLSPYGHISPFRHLSSYRYSYRISPNIDPTSTRSNNVRHHRIGILYHHITNISTRSIIVRHTQMHKEFTKAQLPAELRFRLHNNSKVKMTAVIEVCTDRMRYVHKDYNFVQFLCCLASCDHFAAPPTWRAVKHTCYSLHR